MFRFLAGMGFVQQMMSYIFFFLAGMERVFINTSLHTVYVPLALEGFGKMILRCTGIRGILVHTLSHILCPAQHMFRCIL